MTQFFDTIISRLWNRASDRKTRSASHSALDLGLLVLDGQLSRQHLAIPASKRPQHIAVLGKTGSGKSRLLWHMLSQDIAHGRGVIVFDFHHETTEFLLGVIAAEEQRHGVDLSERLIVIAPADPDFSVGLNVLEQSDRHQNFVQIAEFAQILKQRWRLESLGARSEELLRNTLHLLSDNQLTLLELAPLLTDSSFRAQCLKRSRNSEVSAYFADRYDRASSAMQSVLADAVLNKITTFTSDTRFRHILGQQESTFSLIDAIDQGRWIVLDLDKGRLGEQAATLGSLFLTKLKNALFSRQSRALVSVYADELQNLVAFDSGIDTLLSEARKFGISIITANQFLDQYPQQIRSAILSVGTQVAFQLSAPDAHKIAIALDGGNTLAALLKNLPRRQMVVKSGSARWKQVEVPRVNRTETDYSDLNRRCRQRWAKPRPEIERGIRRRLEAYRQTTNHTLDDWE